MSEGGNGGFDMRRVTDLALEKVNKFKDINPKNEKWRENYIEALGASLSKSKLKKLPGEGSFASLFQPVLPDGQRLPVAVKVVDPSSDGFKDSTKRRAKLATDHELQAVLSDEGFVNFAYKSKPLRLGDLTSDERTFLFYALEHKRYEQFYGPYTLPSLFVAYKAREGARGFWRSKVVMAHVQNLVDLDLRKITDIPPDQLTDSQRDQLKDLANKVEHTFKETGFLPDLKYYKGEPNNTLQDNLRLTRDGRVVLLDTNYLMRSTDKIDTQSVSSTLRNIATPPSRR